MGDATFSPVFPGWTLAETLIPNFVDDVSGGDADAHPRLLPTNDAHLRGVLELIIQRIDAFLRLIFVLWLGLWIG